MSNAKIVLIGVGSADFGLDTLSGLFSEREALNGATLSLVDIDEPSLETVTAFVRRANTELGEPFAVEVTPDRLQALRGADFVVLSVEEDRYPSWKKDWDIPVKHGMVHVLGENGGPGGLGHSLRTVHLTLGICRDVEALAPDAIVLNYTNPMTRVCLGLTRYTNLQVVGLCHGVAMAYEKVGTIMGWVTAPEGSDEWDAEVRAVEGLLEVQACGLNHFTFITDLRDKRTGEDLYPAFRERLASFDPKYQPASKRFHDVFGLYPTLVDNHTGEYLAWARADTHPDKEWPHVDHVAEWLQNDADLKQQMRAAVAGDVPVTDLIEHDPFSHDRAPAIIAQVVQGSDIYELAVNIVNEGCIKGLPDWAVVEVPGVVGSYGVKGIAMGALPAGLTAVLNEQIAIQDRVVEAAVHGDRKAALQALLLDPVSNHDADAAEAMLDELLAAHAKLLPQFA